MSARGAAFKDYMASHMAQQSESAAKAGKLETALWWAFCEGWTARNNSL